MNRILASWMAIVASIALAAPVWAEGGMLDSSSGISPQATKTITVTPSSLTTGVDHVANGVSLRNSCSGTIVLRGIPSGSTLKSAFLYWNYMDGSKVGASTDTEMFNGKRVTGTKVADQPDLCWGTKGDHSYRASITPLASGHNYIFTALNCTDKSGQNPWNPLLTGTPIEPAWDGVSLVETYRNSSTGSDKVAIFDNLAGASNSNAGAHNFAVRMNTGSTVFSGTGLFTQINADGQVGDSFAAECSNGVCTNDERDNFNTIALTGPGGAYPQSDWDGSNGWPLPQLWDTHTMYTEFSGTSINTDTTIATGDCVAPVAYIEQQGGF